jgi:hypothetical protein
MTPPEQQIYVEIGGIDVSRFVRRLTVSRAANAMGGAEAFLDPLVADVPAVDLSGPIYIAALVEHVSNGEGDQQPGRRQSITYPQYDEIPMFTGTIEGVAVANGEVAISCFGGFGNLQDAHVTRLSAQISNVEAIYTIARIAGIPDDRLDIEGIEQIRDAGPELFEIVVPVEGLSVQQRVRVGETWFLPPSTRVDLIGGLKGIEESNPFVGCDCFALAVVEQGLVIDAEALGLRAIDTALAWVTASAHDGRLSKFGRLTEFRRSDLLAYPDRIATVAVRGVLTGRRWVRDMENRKARPILDFAPQGLAPYPALVERTLTESDRQALLAWRRARGASDRLAAVLALWETVEFYCAGISVTSPFSVGDLRILKSAIKSARREIAPELYARVNDLLGKISDPPLLAKLRQAIERDAVPVTESDIDLLKELRTLRNDAVHGRGPGRIPDEKVRHALSVVARMLVERVRVRMSTGPSEGREDADSQSNH